MSKLDYAILYPSNFEKQKVSLAMDAFNKKTVVILELIDKKDTAVLIGAVKRL